MRTAPDSVLPQDPTDIVCMVACYWLVVALAYAALCPREARSLLIQLLTRIVEVLS